MFCALSSSSAISKVSQKALMGKANMRFIADLVLNLCFRTKFFMHGDYQLAYCPIAQIISFAFCDGAFENNLTPELIWRLWVLKRSGSLPLWWKLEVLDIPLLQHLERTPYGYELHKTLPMTYNSSWEVLRELGRDARFEDDIGHYNYRRWAANEVNRMSTNNNLPHQPRGPFLSVPWFEHSFPKIELLWITHAFSYYI